MEKINNREAIAMIISICINMAILVTSQIIIESCASSSILNTFYISIIAIAITFLICYLYKKFVGLSILDISEFLGGKPLKIIVGILFVI